MTTACLDEGRVLAFVEGTLSNDGRSDVEAHLAICRACAELTTWAAADHAHRSRAPGDEGRRLIGTLAPGSRIGRYQILGAVGRGGMGEVYAAYHPDLDRRIALKVVSESGARAPERRARLLREARAIARLSHPNVISVHDAGTVGDRVYIAMEFVDGETVDAWRRARVRNWREILDVFVAAGRGLAAAHAAGIVHRDFKPQNVMIGRDGSVHVMDFGLARLAVEPADGPEAAADANANANIDADADVRPLPATVTKTGALVGTPAYMSPEQFRGEPLDARSDQFSFCVALYEALYGVRPSLLHLRRDAAASAAAKPSRTSGAPVWLRGIIARGLSADRSGRFPSIDALLAAASRGRTRVRRRASGLAIAMAALLLSLGAWRLAAARRVSCAVPAERLAAAWIPGEESDPRRQAIHRAFATSGRPSAETAWQRVSKALDEYVSQWSTMYVQTCEATHVRGEQSGEVLDLRMRCLGENLDEVRALTDVLVRADGAAVSHALNAAQGLTTVSRCADLALLRSAVPLPRNAETLAKVQALRASLRDVRSLVDLGNMKAASRTAAALRPQVEAVGYKPLLGELLELIGLGLTHFEPLSGEPILEDAFLTSEACGDDVTAAKSATHLSFLVGYQLKRPREGKRWAQIASAILDRMGSGHERLRGWLATGYGAVMAASGDLAGAHKLFEQAVTLKERALGPEHPDVAISLSNLAITLTRTGHADDALAAVNRALAIQDKHGDPDAFVRANLHGNRGDVLAALGRHREAEDEFNEVLGIVRASPQSDPENHSQALHGLGELRLAQGQAAAGIALLEQALTVRERDEVDPALTADTRFALAGALWESGSQRRRARSLAAAAKDGYASSNRADKEHAVASWLATHRLAL